MNKTRLFRGDGLKIKNDVCEYEVKHLTVNQIIDFGGEDLDNGEDLYFDLVNLFIIRAFDIMDILDDMGRDYETTSDFEVFLMLFGNGGYDKAFELMFGDTFHLFICEEDFNESVLVSIEKNIHIDKEAYEKIKEFFLAIHCITLAPVYKAGNNAIKKYRINKKRKERKKQQEEPKETSQLYEIVSSILVGGSGSISYYDIWDMPIYTANALLTKTLKFQNYQNTMTGVYSGSVSMKDVSKDVLNWTSE